MQYLDFDIFNTLFLQVGFKYCKRGRVNKDAAKLK